MMGFWMTVFASSVGYLLARLLIVLLEALIDIYEDHLE